MSANTKAGFMRRPKKFQGNPLKEMPELFDAALTEFSGKSFDEASLNSILKAAGSNKGSFYYRFSDKTDLYLCLLDKIAEDKKDYFAGMASSQAFPDDFFEQFRYLCNMGIKYAMHEPRYNKFWRRFVVEKPEVKEIVKKAFSVDSFALLDVLISKAYEKGQFDENFSKDFLITIIELLLNNVDALINQNMEKEGISEIVDKLILLLRSGISAKPNQ